MKYIALYKIGWRIFAVTENQANVLAQKEASFDNPLLCVSEYRGVLPHATADRRPPPTARPDDTWEDEGGACHGE